MAEILIDYALAKYQNAFQHALDDLRKNNIIRRVQIKDYTVWKPKPDEIVNRLGWLQASAETLKKLNDIQSALDPVLKKIDDVVLLGIGGSSLTAEVFGRIFGVKTGYPRLHVLDTTDPLFISEISRSLNLEKTLFLVSSKSGSTLEITSLFKYFYNLVFQKFGQKAGTRFIFVTDEGSPLIKTVESVSAQHIFLNNPDIGGRYSALSLPGIVPAAMIGVDVEKILQRVSSREEQLIEIGAKLGTALGVLAHAGREKMTTILPPRWKPFGDWLEQLIAESTGKEGKGILPVLDEPIQKNAAYGKDRIFVIFQNKDEIKFPPEESLINAGHPVITVKINDDYDLGAQMFIWEMATAVAAHFMGVNPFDQPNVEETKINTRAVIADSSVKGIVDEKPSLIFPECTIFGKINGSTPADALNSFLKQAKGGHYICLQIYLSPSPNVDAAVSHLREAIRQKYSLPVTFGYGPRYLHSTGQLHKGDSGNGLFVQLTQDFSKDVSIPDEIGKKDSSLTFGGLKAAQAQGDWQALTDKGRRIIRLHFQENPLTILKSIINSF
jgi:glucose-6-phosphate isomerase